MGTLILASWPGKNSAAAPTVGLWAAVAEVGQVRGDDLGGVVVQVDREDGVEDDLVAGCAVVVSTGVGVGPALAELAVEVVGVEEVALAVVGS